MLCWYRLTPLGRAIGHIKNISITIYILNNKGTTGTRKLVDAVRISDLHLIKFDELTPLDELVINDIDPNDIARENIVTKRTTISSFIDYLTGLNLVFDKGITINGTLKPEHGEDLIVELTDLTIKGQLTLENTAQVRGLYLNRHLDDVPVNPDSLEKNYGLFWDGDVFDRQGFKGAWVAKPAIEDAPRDGKEYVRKDGEWVVYIPDEPPCDDGLYVRACTGDGDYYWYDISHIILRQRSRLLQENEGQIFTQLGEVIVTESSFSDDKTPGPPGPVGPQGEPGATGATGPAAPEIETYSIDWEGPGNP